MIYSKANFEPARLAACDRETYVQFLADGRSVGANKRSSMVVGIVDDKVKQVVPVAKNGEGSAGECTLSVDACKKVQAALPKDTLFAGLLEHCKVETSAAGVVVETTDGKRNVTATFKDVGRRLPAALWEGLPEFTKGEPVVLNGKRLEILLVALRKACPDRSGETPVWLWLKDGNIVLGTVDYKTGQAAVGTMKAYSGENAAVPEQVRKVIGERKKPVLNKVRRQI